MGKVGHVETRQVASEQGWDQHPYGRIADAVEEGLEEIHLDLAQDVMF